MPKKKVYKKSTSSSLASYEERIHDLQSSLSQLETEKAQLIQIYKSERERTSAAIKELDLTKKELTLTKDQLSKISTEFESLSTTTTSFHVSARDIFLTTLSAVIQSLCISQGLTAGRIASIKSTISDKAVDLTKAILDEFRSSPEFTSIITSINTASTTEAEVE